MRVPAPIVAKPDAWVVREEFVRTDIDPTAPPSTAASRFGGFSSLTCSHVTPGNVRITALPHVCACAVCGNARVTEKIRAVTRERGRLDVMQAVPIDMREPLQHPRGRETLL
jgi:hypothetical protein